MTTRESTESCLVCGSGHATEIFSWNNVPANIAILWETREEALNCNKGDLQIVYCNDCGHTWNLKFDPKLLEYSQAYDNNLHYSPTYSQYARDTAQRLIDKYDLHGKKIIEVGCGKGDFLILLCTLAENQGIGFDASFEERDLQPEVSDRITIINDFYGEKYSSYQGDVIASRYVLEHIEDPRTFLKMIRASIGEKEDTVVFFELPDVYLILEQLSIWDFIYEHVSYFSPGSLSTLFQDCGFKVLDLYEAFGRQFIGIEATPVIESTEDTYDVSADLDRLKHCAATFPVEAERKRNEFQALLERICDENLRTLIWGAGAKGVSYLNMLDIRDEISFIVDINPKKHGKYVAGTGQKIVPPEFTKEFDPHLIIVMNPIYMDEIERMLEQMGVQTEMVLV